MVLAHTVMHFRPQVDPYCVVPLSCFGYTPHIHGSKRVVAVQAVRVRWGVCECSISIINSSGCPELFRGPKNHINIRI